MSQAEIERFVRDVRQNDQLLRELAEGSIGLGHFVDKAKQRGYSFTLAEAKQYIRQHHAPRATDEQLEKVVGGVSYTYTATNVATAAEAAATAVEAQTVATTTTGAAEAEVGVAAVAVIVAS